MRLQTTPTEQTQTPVPAAAFLVCMVVPSSRMLCGFSNLAEMYQLAYEQARAQVAIEQFSRLFQASVN